MDAIPFAGISEPMRDSEDDSVEVPHRSVRSVCGDMDRIPNHDEAPWRGA